MLPDATANVKNTTHYRNMRLFLERTGRAILQNMLFFPPHFRFRFGHAAVGGYRYWNNHRILKTDL